MSAAPEFNLPSLRELRAQTVLGCDWRYYDIGKGPPIEKPRELVAAVEAFLRGE